MSKKKIAETIDKVLGIASGAVRKNAHAIVGLGLLFLTLVILTVFYFVSGDTSRINVKEFEVGRVAERDVVASRDVSYVDIAATELRKEARARLVLPVFKYDETVTDISVKGFNVFASSLRESLSKDLDELSFSLEIQEKFPGLLDKNVVLQLFSAHNSLEIVSDAVNVFSACMSGGIVAIPDKGLERFNPSTMELTFIRDGIVERMEEKFETVPAISRLDNVVEKNALNLRVQKDRIPIIRSLVRPFVRENLLFDEIESTRQLEVAIAGVSPVMVDVVTGQRVIKKGFIITEQNYRDLQAVVAAGFAGDMKELYKALLYLCVTLITACLLFSSRLITKKLQTGEMYFLGAAFCVVYILTLVIVHTDTLSAWLRPLLIPAACMTMLATILVSEQAAVCLSLVLTICTYGLMSSLDICSVACSFVFVSALAGTRVIRRTEKRLDLVYAAAELGIICAILVPILMKVSGIEEFETGLLVLASFFTGFISGILVIGFLPLLENVMNTDTSFRLMELSDLNAPIMKKFMIAAPGSYNHALMVANLAETACRAIGANPLLARVGAYFHDIGKMDQPEYFTENQSDYNKHDDISTRLSATVIRSHVKLGVEKARQLHLPEEVVDIIAEHHGNSVIQYFYAEAVKEEGDSVNPDDFSYPGNPPRSKESAVVMLADTVEAACRTLQHPSAARLEKFIAELVGAKIEAEQLESSDLSFRELNAIKKSFVQVLAGYYHSRIEYPNQKDPDTEEPVISAELVKQVEQAEPVRERKKKKE